jgi:hypothetical protein
LVVAFFDESGTHGDSGVFAIAGYVAAQEDWIKFETDWKRELRRAGISYFHMVEYENRRGTFATWSNKKRREVLGDLLRVIKAHALIGLAACVVVADFERVFRPALPAGHPYRDPYIFCLQVGMERIAHHFGPYLPQSEKVACVFEERNKVAYSAARHYEAVKGHNEWGTLFGSISFGGKRDYVPLQAADVIAYESRKAMMRLIAGERTRERYSLAMLRDGLAHECSYCDAEAMEKLLEQMRERGKL